MFPRKSGHRVTRPEALPFGGDVPEGGEEPLTVVVSFDIGEQVSLGRLAGRIGGVVNQLGFERVEPAFHRRIVPSNCPSGSSTARCRSLSATRGNRRRHIDCPGRSGGAIHDRAAAAGSPWSGRRSSTPGPGDRASPLPPPCG